MIKEKNFLLFFFVCIISILISKIFLTKISYHLISKYEFNNFITSKYLKDERLNKMMLLKKNNKSFTTYFFGTSSATVYYPNDLKNLNINSFNTSFSAASTSEHLKFLNWIIQNKSKPEFIYLELRDHSLLDHEYDVIMPPEFLNFFLKIRFYLTDFSTFNFILNKVTGYDNYLFKLENIIRDRLKNYISLNTEQEKAIKENKSKKLDYVLTGARYYQSYFDRKNNKYLQEVHNKEIINNYLPIVGKNIDDKKLTDLKRFIDICKINNIKYKVFFGPVHKNLLKKNKYEYLIRELFIIEQILNRDIVSKIFYFNNNEHSQEIKNFEKDLVHYNYDVAYKIAESLISDKIKNTNNLIVLTKNNIIDYKKKVD